MTWSRLIFSYLLLWAVVELARPWCGLTQLLWAHDLLLAAALCGGGVALSLRVEEWLWGQA